MHYAIICCCRQCNSILYKNNNNHWAKITNKTRTNANKILRYINILLKKNIHKSSIHFIANLSICCYSPFNNFLQEQQKKKNDLCFMICCEQFKTWRSFSYYSYIQEHLSLQILYIFLCFKDEQFCSPTRSTCWLLFKNTE